MDPLPNQFVLSVVVPVFNEVNTISKVIDRLRGCGLPCEIIVVDDGSSDGTREILKGLQQEEELRVLYRERNQGKGAAVKDGFACARGDVVVIQDADMEYDPRDLPSLLQPILEERADVVYGSRYLPQSDNVSPWWHRAGNRLISCLFNFGRRKKFSDVETCYKVFKREIIQSIELQEKRFGIEPEITAKLSKLDIRIYEVGISYYGRTYEEGKKIGWKDGVAA
ncbi:MAG: glycosyltransferase family 2 protein, partial [Planctomycetes bacterium]|nr:glycosyltransferase family 2 protein [Planctomycetota bacterium]